MVQPDLVEAAEGFVEKLRHWKNESLHALLHDLQKAMASEGEEKVRAARLESLVRAVKETIGYEPPKSDDKATETKPPHDETVGAKFRRLAPVGSAA